jgi:hypothetical protein
MATVCFIKAELILKLKKKDVERSSSLLKTGRPSVQAGHGPRSPKKISYRLIRKLRKVYERMAHSRLAGTNGLAN